MNYPSLSSAPNVTPTQLSIVGMGITWGGCPHLERFQQVIYRGEQLFRALPSARWPDPTNLSDVLRQYGIEHPDSIQGAFFDPVVGMSPEAATSVLETDSLPQGGAQALLMTEVANQALKDAQIQPGARVAVLISAATILALNAELHRVLQVRQADHYSLSGKYFNKHGAALHSDYPDPPGFPIARQITHAWHFTGVSYTLTAEENSVLKLLQVAKSLLANEEVDTVLVGAVDLVGSPRSLLLNHSLSSLNQGKPSLSFDRQTAGWTPGEGACAIVLQRSHSGHQPHKVYAVIEAMSLINIEEIPRLMSSRGISQTITQVCEESFRTSTYGPQNIDYLEVCGSGIPTKDDSEISGLLQAYCQSAEPSLTCALGSVRANVGYAPAVSTLVSLIKTALCLYYHYLPATPNWQEPKQAEQWQGSPFYIAPTSRPWFKRADAAVRVAAINGLDPDGTCGHLILSDPPRATLKPDHETILSRYLAQLPLILLPIAGTNSSELLAEITRCQQHLASTDNLFQFARTTYQRFQQRSSLPYAVAIVGHSRDEIQAELERAVKGIPRAFEQGRPWKTPKGSFFTSHPQGRQGRIAYVYPGALSSYVGLGQNLFHLFPKAYDFITDYVQDAGAVFGEQLIFPRSLRALSRREWEDRDNQLINNSLVMLRSGMAFSTLLSAILNEYFHVKPDQVFGYSLGEISMLCAQQVWQNYDHASYTLASSPLFQHKLAGPKNTVRQLWNMPPGQTDADGAFWETHLVMAPIIELQRALLGYDRVYLTQINTFREAIIAGDGIACRALIHHLGCDSVRVPATNVIHCDVVASEYEELIRLNLLPVQQQPEVTFYSAAHYGPLLLDSEGIAHALAKSICQPLNFPKLIDQVYADGARVFIETGAGNTCSRWISENLGTRPHAAIAIDKRGLADEECWLRALAQMVSHLVPLTLDALYQQPQLQFQVQLSEPLKAQDNSFSSNHFSLPESPPNPSAINPLETVSQDSQFSKNYSLNDPTKERNELKSMNEMTDIPPLANFPHQPISLLSNYALDPWLAFPKQPLMKWQDNAKKVSQLHGEFLEHRRYSIEKLYDLIQLKIDLIKQR